MPELKPIRRNSIDNALERAHHYRLLNEPMHAESICLDVLAVDSENQRALDTLLLSLTDQFDRRLGARCKRAMELLPRLEDPYRRVYYEGLICERRAAALYRRRHPGAGHAAFEWYRRALACYERAEELSPDGNDDAVLRWNTCVRVIDGNPDLEAEPHGEDVEMLE